MLGWYSTDIYFQDQYSENRMINISWFLSLDIFILEVQINKSNVGRTQTDELSHSPTTLSRRQGEYRYTSDSTSTGFLDEKGLNEYPRHTWLWLPFTQRKWFFSHHLITDKIEWLESWRLLKESNPLKHWIRSIFKKNQFTLLMKSHILHWRLDSENPL